MLASCLASAEIKARSSQAICELRKDHEYFNSRRKDQRHRGSFSPKMKLLSLVSAWLFSSAALAAKKSAGSNFEAYHARAVSSTPIGIDDAGYERMTAAPRDYSVAVLLTALEDRYGCKICRDFQPEWNIIANSWQKDKQRETRTLFATLDFGNGRATFMKV